MNYIANQHFVYIFLKLILIFLDTKDIYKAMPAVCSTLVEGKKCGKRAYFNEVGEKAKFCVDHKEESMINVTRVTCTFETNGAMCGKRAMFKSKENKSVCGEHKDAESVNINHKKCLHVVEGKRVCGNRAIFGIASSNNPEYCDVHKMKHMVSSKVWTS